MAKAGADGSFAPSGGQTLAGTERAMCGRLTHWPPTLDALHPMYADASTTESLLNRYFINDEPGLVREMGAKFRTSGHTHMPHEAGIGATTSVGNPAGYRNEGRGAGFQPDRVIEVEPSHGAHEEACASTEVEPAGAGE